MNKENETIIKAINMHGRVPKEWELLDEIERLNNIINELEKWLEEQQKEIERLNNIINKALEKSKGLQYRFGYVLDDLIYLLMQGSDKE